MDSGFIDLTKAFDTVCHARLLHKLDSIGIKGNALTLIKSYLQNKKSEINKTLSDPSLVEWGVSQQTVLGPILCTIYINDFFVWHYRWNGNLLC